MEINGVQYHVEVTRAPPLLLHGFTGSSRIASISPHLNTHFSTITLDLLGHDKPICPLTHCAMIEHAADDLAVIMSRLNLNTVNMLGYRWAAGWRFMCD
jgi:pimeloyl-ACP methyl ester carboxylesterase